MFCGRMTVNKGPHAISSGHDLHVVYSYELCNLRSNCTKLLHKGLSNDKQHRVWASNCSPAECEGRIIIWRQKLI